MHISSSTLSTNHLAYKANHSPIIFAEVKKCAALLPLPCMLLWTACSQRWTRCSWFPAQIHTCMYVYMCILYFYSKSNQMHNISNLFYFGTTLHVSDSLSIHHQESKTVHTSSGMSYRFCGCKQPQNLYDIYLMLYVVLKSWWWTERPSETCSVVPK